MQKTPETLPPNKNKDGRKKFRHCGSSTIATQREEKNRPLFWVVDGITLCGMISKLLQLAKRETADFVSS